MAINLNNLDLSNHNFRNTNLVNVSLYNTNLTGADLTNANLTGANLTRAKIKVYAAGTNSVEFWCEMIKKYPNLHLTNFDLASLNESEQSQIKTALFEALKKETQRELDNPDPNVDLISWKEQPCNDLSFLRNYSGPQVIPEPSAPPFPQNDYNGPSLNNTQGTAPPLSEANVPYQERFFKKAKHTTQSLKTVIHKLEREVSTAFKNAPTVEKKIITSFHNASKEAFFSFFNQFKPEPKAKNNHTHTVKDEIKTFFKKIF